LFSKQRLPFGFQALASHRIPLDGNLNRRKRRKQREVKGHFWLYNRDLALCLLCSLLFKK
jgi:hypothetical protein